MTIFIDDAAIPKSGKKWYHLMSDGDDNEIHQFAAKIGLKREWFHVDHYDLVSGKRQQAIDLGAQPVAALKLVEIRKQKRANNV